MNGSTQPLDQLRDIHLGEPISWWPLAPGWWLLLIAVMIVLLLVAWLYSQRKSMAAQHAALNHLQTLQTEYRQHGDRQALLCNLSMLLRRYAIASFPRREVAGLTGKAWLSFLDQTGGQGRFCSPVGQALVSGPYRASVDEDPTPLIAYARDWIKRVPQAQMAQRKGHKQ